MLKYFKYSLFVASFVVFGSWGFHAHRTINRHAVYTLPKGLQVFFIENIEEIEAGAVRADKRRYIDSDEACKHYIDLDLYGSSPMDSVPKYWYAAIEKYTEDTLKSRGILPWVITWQYTKLVWAMDSGSAEQVLRYASDLGHYIADACVPLHTTYNYNGQYTHQKGIHALWESRIPESFSDSYDYYIEKTVYLDRPLEYSWKIIQESHALVDSVLFIESELTTRFSDDEKYRFELKNGQNVSQYSFEFIRDYNLALNGMVESRMRRAIHTIGSFWYTAWIDAGQPDLSRLKFEKQKKEGIKEIISPKRIHE